MPRHRYTLSRDLSRPVAAALVVVFAVTLISFAVSWILEDTMNRWARRLPAPGQQYAIHVVGGVTYYLPPHLGWYLDNSLWLHFAGLALFFLIPFLAGAGWKAVE